jgi:hypothetical protein
LPAECETAFEKAKEALTNVTTLVVPDSNSPYNITTDCSNIAMGAVLQQWDKNKKAWCPIAFFSKKLTPAESRYSTVDQELLAVYKSIKHFRHWVEERDLVIFTDHKPLERVLDSKAVKNPRQDNHLELISQFTNDIRHKAGKDNTVADYLSRSDPEITLLETDINFLEFTGIDLDNLMTLQDKYLQQNNSASLNIERIKIGDIEILCKTSTNKIKPYVPKILRKQYFENLHKLSHPGITASVKLVKSKYFWPKINQDVKTWTKQCLGCQIAKVNKHHKSEVGELPIPEGRFDDIHIDLVGPLPPSKGFSYV